MCVFQKDPNKSKAPNKICALNFKSKIKNAFRFKLRKNPIYDLVLWSPFALNVETTFRKLRTKRSKINKQSRFY